MLAQFIFFLSFLFILYQYLKPRRPQNFPPGPSGYPIVGYLQIFGLDAVFGKALMIMAEKYGPVCGIQLGKYPAVLVNGWEAVKEVLTRDEFLFRAHTEYIGEVNGFQLGLLFSSGDFWRGQRRFTMRQLRDSGFGKMTIESTIHEEITECVERIKTQAEQSPKSTVVLTNTFGVSVSNVVWSVMAGRRFAHNDERFKGVVDIIDADARNLGPLHLLISDWPFLRHFPPFSKAYKILNGAEIGVNKMVEETIEEHEKTRDPETPRDFIDTYFNEIDSQKAQGLENPHFFKAQLRRVCADLFRAGGESTANSVSFSMLYMLLHPEVQFKVQEELDRVIGRNRLPSWADKDKLPYTAAVMHEVFRINLVTQTTVPHSPGEKTKLFGYDIPKGVTMIVNLHSVHYDRAYWGDPENFRPERFLSPDGKFVKPERVVPFGMGRRGCPGESLARMIYFLFFTTMMQSFTVEADPDSPNPSTVALNGFTVAPQPFKAKVTARADK